MTSLEAYKRFLININKNDSNRNINIPKGQFVLIYNDQALVWEEDKIKNNLGTDRIDDISELLVLDQKLDKIGNEDKFSTFKLPEDFFEYSSSYSLASKEGCSNSVVYNWNSKNKNKNNLLINSNDDPSFEYQETFLTQNSNSLNIYKTDFEIDDVYLDYYRTPVKIDISGYTKVDGESSSEINPDISDKLVNEILEYCKKEVIKIYVTPEAYETRNK